MNFANPDMLKVMVVVVLALSGFFYWAWRKRQHDITLFVRSRLLAQLTMGVSVVRQKIRLVLLVLAVAGLFVALAQPRWGFTLEEATQQGLDIVVAIDTSRSMLAEDMAPNRLTRAKLATLELLPLAKSDRLGLVAFAGTAFLQCPLTLDEEAFRQSVNVLEVNIIPQGGTAIAEAIDTALTAFKQSGDNQKVLILFTDGEDHEHGVLESARAAAKENVRIFTVGVGTSEGDLLRQKSEQGAQAYIKDDEGNVVKSRLDPALLENVAEAAQGIFLPLRGANTMDLLYERGLKPLLPKFTVGATGSAAERGPRLLRQFHERYQWPLGFAIALLLLEMFLPERKMAFRPATGQPGSPSPAKALPVLLCWVLAGATTVRADAGKALRLYQEGFYQSAQKEYERLHERKPKDARLSFNAGTAAYQAKNYEDAEGHFNDSLLSADVSLQQRAYYNLGNTQFRQGEQESETPEKIHAWEQAIKNYDAALKLDARDEDARFNRDVVKKMLEELKQQQQQQDKNKPSDDSKDRQDQQDQQKQDQQKSDQQKQDQQKKDSDSSQKQDQAKQQEQQQPDQSKADQSKDQQNKEQQKKEQQTNQSDQAKSKEQEQKKDKEEQPQPAQPQDQKPGEEQSGEAEPAKPGQMTRQQAQRLLDAQKNEEKAILFIDPEKLRQRDRRFKDW